MVSSVWQIVARQQARSGQQCRLVGREIFDSQVSSIAMDIPCKEQHALNARRIERGLSGGGNDGAPHRKKRGPFE
ncbi:hypothetical protein WJ63_36925 [Burkholderia pyrrocinia]|nr:hypothetical protein WJ63_36925 [Burkholderia pyrrocinia]